MQPNFTLHLLHTNDNQAHLEPIKVEEYELGGIARSHSVSYLNTSLYIRLNKRCDTQSLLQVMELSIRAIGQRLNELNLQKAQSE